MHTVVLSILIVFSCSLVAEPKISRIIGGSVARAGQFPFSAAIYKTTENGRYFCGGALISDQWILTAGQCVNGAILFKINLGSNSLQSDDPNRLTLATSDYKLHPDFNPTTLENDVGLIRLRLPVTYTEYIQRILLPFDNINDDIHIGIGWGQTSDLTDELSENLRFVNLIAVSDDFCKAIYGNQIYDTMICVIGDFNEGTCTGDTGSPLIDNDPVIVRFAGIASFISGNLCESTDPSGYTRVFPYVDWIINVTNGEV